MIPRVKRAAARPPDGGEMVLYQHDRDFSIKINGEDLIPLYSFSQKAGDRPAHE